MKVKSIYEDGNAYDATVLEISDADISNAFCDGLRQVASLCFELNYPTLVNVPHSVVNTLKKVIAVGLSLNSYSFEKLTKIKEILENPDAFKAVAAPASGAAAAGGGAANKAPVKEKSATPQKSSEKAGAANMFGGGGDDDSDS